MEVLFILGCFQIVQALACRYFIKRLLDDWEKSRHTPSMPLNKAKAANPWYGLSGYQTKTQLLGDHNVADYRKKQ